MKDQGGSYMWVLQLNYELLLQRQQDNHPV